MSEKCAMNSAGSAQENHHAGQQPLEPQSLQHSSSGYGNAGGSGDPYEFYREKYHKVMNELWGKDDEI